MYTKLLFRFIINKDFKGNGPKEQCGPGWDLYSLRTLLSEKLNVSFRCLLFVAVGISLVNLHMPGNSPWAISPV